MMKRYNFTVYQHAYFIVTGQSKCSPQTAGGIMRVILKLGIYTLYYNFFDTGSIYFTKKRVGNEKLKGMVSSTKLKCQNNHKCYHPLSNIVCGELLKIVSLWVC